MSSSVSEGDASCPYLVGAGGAYPLPRPSSRARCHAGVTARVIPVHRQTALCLSSDYARCPEYQRYSTADEVEREGWWTSLRSLDFGFAGRALVSLMVGVIVLAFFAMAPRPGPPLEAGAPQATATGVAANGEAGGGKNPVATEGTPTATQEPTPSPTPVPPTATPARAVAPKPTVSPAGTYVVKPRDTLYSIAHTYGVTVEELSKANNLSDPKRLRAGQTIRIP